MGYRDMSIAEALASPSARRELGLRAAPVSAERAFALATGFSMDDDRDGEKAARRARWTRKKAQFDGRGR